MATRPGATLGGHLIAVTGENLRFRTLTTLLIACATLFAHPLVQAESAMGQKAVLITGANSGLGRVMAETEVAGVVMKSLFEDHPKPCFLIVPNQEQAYWTINRAMERMVEQNNDQKFSYDRAELIEMLDAALAKQAGKSP